MFRKFLAALAALVVLAGLTACSGDNVKWEDELTNAGFTDPTRIVDNTSRKVYLATAGTCRIRLVVNVELGRIYATAPDGNIDEVESFIADPTPGLLKQDERFAHCFMEDSD